LRKGWNVAEPLSHFAHASCHEPPCSHACCSFFNSTALVLYRKPCSHGACSSRRRDCRWPGNSTDLLLRSVRQRLLVHHRLADSHTFATPVLFRDFALVGGRSTSRHRFAQCGMRCVQRRFQPPGYLRSVVPVTLFNGSTMPPAEALITCAWFNQNVGSKQRRPKSLREPISETDKNNDIPGQGKGDSSV
jgi:hypothetical protein